MKTWAKILLGVILIIVAVVVAFKSPVWWGDTFDFWSASGEFFKGALFWIILIVGVILLLLGISDVHNKVKSNYKETVLNQ